MRVGLIGCVKTKQRAAAKAAELYISPLFVGRRRWVEQTCDRWYVLSALHGLLHPDEVVSPYDVTLVGAPRAERTAWARRVLAQIGGELGDVSGVVFEVHAGAAYRDHGLVSGLRSRGARVEIPAAGLSQGGQLALYGRGPGGGRAEVSSGKVTPGMVSPGPVAPASDRQAEPGGPPQHAPSPASARPSVAGRQRSLPPPAVQRQTSTYAPLHRYLSERPSQVVAMSFAELERILGRALPASARRHRAWWANETAGTHSHARSWTGAGYDVVSVDLRSERVAFRPR